MSQPLFLAYFVEAYTLRNVLANIYKEVGQMTTIFTKEHILTSVRNKDNYATIEFKIKTCELQKYEYNAVDEAGNLLAEFPVGLETQKMMLATKTIGRKDGLCIYMHPEKHSVYVKTIASSNGSRPNPVSIIQEATLDGYEYYELPPYKRSDDNPNVSVYAKEFSTMCNAMVVNKCSCVDIVPYETGVLFRGIAADKSEIRIEPFGNCVCAEGEEEPTPIRIPIKTIKALSKINAFSTTGSKIKIYHEGGPLKMVSPVGTYGTYTIVLKNTAC